MKQKAKYSVEDNIVNLLKYFGEDLTREGLRETPARVIRMYKELLDGYNKDEREVFKLFDSNGFHDLVTVSNINFYSLCEHHMIPFFGKVHIGYLPNGKVLGLSKFARLVDIYSRRLQTQENITKQVADAIEKYLNPMGLIVVIEAQHLCMCMRGIKKKGIVTTTSITRGKLSKEKQLIDQFYRDLANYSLKEK